MKWITATDIDNWTAREPRRAQEIIPLLVWKLILASCKTIKDHHFPFGKAVQYSGYDGALDTEDISPFFPNGKSVWEIGTNENALEKFNSDYEKRTKEPNGIDQANTTFCFVTSRIWNHRQGIAETTEAKAKDGKWKDVRIIDANCLELWLDACPSVHMWFSAKMGMPYAGVQDINSYWEDTIAATHPQLNAEFFLYKRKSIANELLSIGCSDTTKQVVVVADSWREVVLCIAAEVSSSDDISVVSLGEKCVVAHTPDALNEIDSHYENAIIIPTFHLSDSSVTVQRNTLVLPVDRYNPLEKISRSGHRVLIPQRTRHEFCEAIEKLGYETNTAFEMGQKLHCSFPALFRQVQTNPLEKVPEWSRHEGSGNLIPALFAGAWEERSCGDKEIISILAGCPYDEYIASIIDFTKGENAPIFSVDRSYACISIEEMWTFLWTKVTPKAFDSFKECFIKVFSETDPTYELPEQQWYAAALFGKSPSYSSQLKESMIVTLIMMTELENTMSCGGFSNNISRECAALVKEVFDSIDSLDKWRTICQYIPTFIEAAPDVVLRIFEHESINPDSFIWDLFITSPNPLFGRSFYTHILWALEKTLWDKKYAVRALRLLLAFAEKNFAYSLANKPEDTLYRVFCIWHPQGIFSFEERKALLADIIQNHGAIAPRLIKKLLSVVGQTTHDISMPKWKILESKQDTVADAEIAEMRDYLSTLYLENISPCYESWSTVFSDLPTFAPIAHVVDKCIEQSSQICEEDILKLCKDLSQYISRKRKFRHESEEVISEVEHLYYSILPNSPKYFAHYFSYDFYGLNPIPYKSDEYDLEEERNALFNFQKEKMREMIAKYGFGAVLEIIPFIEDSSAYANAIVEEVLHGEADWKLIFKIRECNQYLASSTIASLYYKMGIEKLVEGDSIPQGTEFGWVLSCLPICEEVTKIVDETDNDICKRTYWENVRIFGMKGKNTAWVNKCIHSLVESNRPYSVIDNFAYSDWNDPEIVMEVLSSALIQYPNPEPSGLQLSHVGSYDVEKFFEKLYIKPTVPDIDVARIELAYLKAFDMDFEPKCLVRQVLSSPELYFELLTSAYRSDNDDNRKLSEQQRKFAEMSNEALRRIQRIPGSSAENGSVNETEFDNWISETDNLAKDKKYSRAHDIVLGQILSYSPVGQDGIWPAECVRNVFEKPHSECLENHFVIGKKNQRGVHTVSAGTEEERIAEDYKRQADGLQLLYPHTAAILLRLSDEYRAESKAERARELKGYF